MHIEATRSWETKAYCHVMPGRISMDIEALRGLGCEGVPLGTSSRTGRWATKIYAKGGLASSEEFVLTLRAGKAAPTAFRHLHGQEAVRTPEEIGRRHLLGLKHRSVTQPMPCHELEAVKVISHRSSIPPPSAAGYKESMRSRHQGLQRL